MRVLERFMNPNLSAVGAKAALALVFTGAAAMGAHGSAVLYAVSGVLLLPALARLSRRFFL